MIEASEATQKSLEAAAWQGNETAKILFYAIDFAKYADETCNTRYTVAGLRVASCVDESMNVLRGLGVLYPNLVRVYNTHDLNYALISDINKLAKCVTA